MHAHSYVHACTHTHVHTHKCMHYTNNAIIAIHNSFLSAFCLNFADIDECSSSPCGHTCTNTVGSFVCSCNDGYVLDSDGLSCNGAVT